MHRMPIKVTHKPPEILALIPARGGSTGVPRKNVRVVAGKPLLVHSIEHAHQSLLIRRTIVSTDDPKIAEIARAAGAEVPFIRPAAFATDTAVDLGVFRHALEWLRDSERYVPDLVVQLRPTAPVRRVRTLDLAIRRMLASPDADSLRAVSVAPFTPYKMWFVEGDLDLRPVMASPGIVDWFDQPRQALPKVYAQNGFVDIVRPRTVLEKSSMAGDRMLAFLHADPVIDIDDERSLQAAGRAIEALAIPRVGYAEARAWRVGIVQGRLSPAPWNVLQHVPRDGWAEEFARASALGLSHVELVLQRQHDPHYPLWGTDGLSQLQASAERSGVVVQSACVDYVIDHSLCSDATLDYLAVAFERLALAGVKTVVLPLFEHSDPAAVGMVRLAAALGRCANTARRHGLLVCIESLLDASATHTLLGLTGEPDVRVCYDTGNIVPLGYDVGEELRDIGGVVAHVHVKDKTRDGESVRLGTGGSSFPDVVRALAEIGYSGAFTLETPREEDPLAAARRNLAFFRQQIDSHAR